MLDRYLDGLVKEAKVKNKLDLHLEQMVKEASAEVELEAFLDRANAAELAKLAGVELAEGVCPQCASEMQKLGSIYQCSCGMTKKANVLRMGAGKGATLAREMMPGGTRMLSGAPQTAEQAAAKLFTGVGGGAPTARELASTGKLRQMAAALKARMPSRAASPPLEGMAVTAAAKELPPELAANAAKTEAVQDPETPGAEVPETSGTEESKGDDKGKESKMKCASIANFAQAVIASDGNVKLAFHVLADAGFTDLGFSDEDIEKNAFLGQAAKTLGTGLKGAWQTLRAGSAGGGGLRAAAGQAGQAVKGFGGDVAKGVRSYGQQVGDTYRAGKEGLRQTGEGVAGVTGGHREGVMGGLGAVARRHPGLVAGAAALPVAGGLAYKAASAQGVLKVGDIAGRLMAKTALELTPEEVGEAIEEAKAREDIPGRAASWGRRGAALGGLGGAGVGAGLGFGASKLLGGKGKVLGPVLGGLAGAGGGGVLGHRIGREEGAEEAAADRLVSMLRGRKAYMAGGQHGYVSGLQRGYMAGRSPGGPGPQ